MSEHHIGPIELRDYVAARPGALFTCAEVAAAMPFVRDDRDADAWLRILAQDYKFGELTERQGGWVFWPREGSKHSTQSGPPDGTNEQTGYAWNE